MGKEETCGVCGGTESKLVDGYYYCVECGTQDTTVRETLVDHQMIDDGNYAIGRQTKYSVKRKEGVEMSPEWYKWHTYNFILAGLTEQLIELGAAPTLRMKVLWIWSRYIKMYQKKDEIGRFRMLSQLEDGGDASDDEAAAAAAERSVVRTLLTHGPRVDRVSRQVLIAMLALALNFDHSPLQVSHFTRFVTFRLLTVNDPLRFVPLELIRKQKHLELSQHGTLFVCNDLPLVMQRLMSMLELGPARVPDVEALVASQLRELRLPRGLGRLVAALLRLLPAPWRRCGRGRGHRGGAATFPDYETTVLAYVVVALKMCFGLDDDYEVRLSDVADRINGEAGRPRAYFGEPEPTGRLFSFRSWSAHLRHRALLLSRQYGPLAWQRNMRTSDCALMEHFREFTTVWARDKRTEPRLSDAVTMDILGRLPARFSAEVLPLEALRAAAAAREPAAALARLAAPRLPPARRRLLHEDFPRYSLRYACARLALPPGRALRGVRRARKRFREGIGRHLLLARADPTVVYVKDCENKNWAKTRRPTAAHVVEDEAEAEARGAADPARASPAEEEPETFLEETEGTNIFDDDFLDIQIKEEKVEIAPDPPGDLDDDAKDDNFSCDDFESGAPSAAGRGGGDGDGGVFDSDEERDAGPQFDPAAFDRAETIKRIMVAAYKKYIGCEALTPVRFRTVQRQPKEKSVADRRVEGDKRARAWARKRELVDGKAAIDDIVLSYQSSLATDVMHQVAERVQTFVDAAAGRPEPDSPEPVRRPGADAGDGAPDDSRDVQVIENDAETKSENDDDSFDGPAYDPVLEGDEKFDEKTHDASQLFLKLAAAPPAAPGDRDDLDDVSFLDKTLDFDALREEMRRKQYETYRRLASWRRKKENIDHLVDDPESITKFNYWFKHYKYCNGWETKLVQVEMDESFPRSFRFVLRECAATLGVSQSYLYMRVCDVERTMLSLLRGGGNSKRKRKPSASATPEEQPKIKISKNNKNKAQIRKNTDAKASKSIRNNTRARKNIRSKAKVSHYTSDDESASDGVCDSRDSSGSEAVSKEKLAPDDEPAAAPDDEPDDEPVDEPAAAPDDEPDDEPAAAPDDEPAAALDDEPDDEPAAAPDDEPAAAPDDEPDDEPAAAPARRSGRLRRKAAADPFWR